MLEMADMTDVYWQTKHFDIVEQEACIGNELGLSIVEQGSSV